MGESRVTADISQVMTLGKDFHRAAEIGVRQVTERAEQLVRAEAPEATDKANTGVGGNLKQGVSSDVQTGKGLLQGEVVVTAESGRQARREALLIRPSGKVKKVSLRAIASFNYAEAVARGTGEFGPRRTRIKPKKAKALLVPVDSPPTLNGKPAPYILYDGQIFAMRRSIKGTKPNPYDERAAKRLETEAQPIFDKVLKKVVDGEL